MGEMRSLDMELVSEITGKVSGLNGKRKGETTLKTYNSKIGHIRTYEMFRYDDGETKEIIPSTQTYLKNEMEKFYGTGIFPGATIYTPEQVEKLRQIKKNAREFER